MVSLIELARQVEALPREQPDDGALAWQVETAVWRHLGALDHTRWSYDEEAGVWMWGDPRVDSDWDRRQPEYLDSWDAAVSLVPADRHLTISGGGDRWRATIKANSAPGFGQAMGISWNAPRAIVAAAIRCRQLDLMPRGDGAG